jgi:hypothetical protein
VGALENPRYEAFAQALAKGKSASEAYKKAGFKANRGNASRLKAHESVSRRLAELREVREKQAASPPDLSGRDSESQQFLKGFSRGGRPLGSRNKLSEAFLADLHRKWEQCGEAVLDRVEKDDPVAFTKLVAAVLPAKIDTSIDLNVGLFAEIRNFSEAWKWKLAQQVIGADPDPLLIENEAKAE